MPRRPADRWWALGVAGTSSLLLATTVTDLVRFGDSAESVAGVESFGVLHAPGYVAYMVVGWLFAAVVPVGDLALRLNLFSAACSVAAVALVYRAGRRLGAAPLGAALGAMVLATSAAFWFYGGYAKAYAPTSLLLAAVLLLALAWREDGRTWRVLAVAALLGASLGLSWQVVSLAAPGIAVLVLIGPRRPTWRQVAASAGVGAVVVAAMGAFILVRAGQDPAVNWGEATTVDRVVDLVRMRDFGFGEGGGIRDVRGDTTSAAGASTHAASTLTVGFQPVGLVWWVRHAAIDLSPAALVLAAIGAIAGVRSPATRRATVGLLAVLGGNVTGAIAVLGTGWLARGPDGVLRFGGFLLAAPIVLALLAGVGTTTAMAALAERGRAPQGRAGQRRARRSPGDHRSFPQARWAAPLIGVVAIGSAVVLPAVQTRSLASHHEPPFAAEYAANVFDRLPRDAMLLAFDAERVFPLLHRQIVLRDRPDVDIVLIDLLTRPWYREQTARRLDISLAPQPAGDWFVEAANLGRALLGERPVYADLDGMGLMAGLAGFEQQGLVGRMIDEAALVPPDPADVGLWLAEEARTTGIYTHPARLRWPNRLMLAPYVYAHTELAVALGQQGDLDGAERYVRLALQVDPRDEVARDTLAVVQQLRAEQ